jgi:hypothetical protein
MIDSPGPHKKHPNIPAVEARYIGTLYLFNTVAQKEQVG